MTTYSTQANGRKLVLVDIENLAGTPAPSEADVCAAMSQLGYLLSNFDAAQVIVACSHRAAKDVAFGCANARHLWKSGPDGADLALLEVLSDERVETRFTEIVVCSGDGIFAEAVASLGRMGISVTVVALHGHLSSRLRLAASTVIELNINSNMNLAEPA